MSRRHLVTSVVLASLTGLLAVGCGSSDGTVKVTGSVVKGGKAEEGVMVAFASSDSKDETTKSARTDAAGKFEVRVKPGKYVVVLTKMVDRKGNLPKDSDNPAEDAGQLEAGGQLRNAVPQKYADAASSPLGVEIPSEGKELPPFDISK